MVFRQASLLLIWEPRLAQEFLGVPVCSRGQLALDPAPDLASGGPTVLREARLLLILGLPAALGAHWNFIWGPF